MRFISTVGERRAQPTIVIGSDGAVGRAFQPELQRAGFAVSCVGHAALDEVILMKSPDVVLAIGERAVHACELARKAMRRSGGRIRVVALVGDPAARFAAISAGADHVEVATEPTAELIARVTWLAEDRRVEHAMANKVDTIRLWQDWVRYLIHDLRQPLTVATSCLQLARIRRSADEVKADLDAVEEAHADMRWMLQDLLDTDRLRHGALELEREDMDIADVAREVAERIRIGHAVDVTSNGDTRIAADRRLLGRVFGNLLTNASRYAREQPIRVAITGTPHGVSAAVVNDGPGIATELLPHLFDPWHSYAGGDTGGNRATGIGLAFCRLVCEAHAGQIWVESSEPGEVAFAFGIPRVAAERATVTP